MRKLNYARINKLIASLIRNRIVEAMVIFLASFLIVFVLLGSFKVEPAGVGGKLLDFWCDVRGMDNVRCVGEFGSNYTMVEQALSLALFITVIALTAISMRLRYFAAILALFSLVFLGITPPQHLIMGVEWRLIVFLMGSMMFATILRTMGVLRLIALFILRASRQSPILFITLLSFISWFLAMVVGEATSIIYVVMLLLDVRKLTGKDIRPLVVLAVLATNVGSLAMPVGNPIGIYLAFTAKLHASDFIFNALPLSLITLLSLILSAHYSLRKNVKEVVDAMTPEKVDILLTEFRTRISRKEKIAIAYGLLLLIGFLIAVSVSNYLANILQDVYGEPVDPHSLLAFIPYFFIFLSLEEYKPEKLESVLIHGVEWPSLFFFITLFMLGHSLTWTGAVVKIAYLVTVISLGLGEFALREILLTVTALTSAFLDNLSVIVAFTPVAQSLVHVGASTTLYWALLFGGVLGGNFTPIGSTANIVALGICEKAKMRIPWKEWLKLALIPTLIQVLISCVWIIF